MGEFTHRLPHRPWSKPSRNEEEYFHRAEFQKRMTKAREREARREAEQRTRWLEEHRDRCPKCYGRLIPVRVAGGSADQCSNCLGVWLDHETFNRLTHPEERDDYLTGILRDVLLQFTTGEVRPRRPEE